MNVQPLDALDPASPLGRRWEALVMDNPAAGIMQSLHWADLKRRQGLRVLHLGLFDGGELVGGALCYSPPPRHPGLMLVPEGPVLPWQAAATARAGLRQLMAAAEQAAAALGGVALRIEPRLELPLPAALRSFRRAPIDLVPSETLYLDLTPAPAQLLAQMRPKGRYNIRLADRRGVVVSESYDPADASRFYAVLAEAACRDQFFVEPVSFFCNLAEALCPAGLARFLFATRDGALLGALLLTTYGQRATYLYGGVANHGRTHMAGYALQWAAISAARQAGCSVYDFYGYEPHGTPNHLYAGFSRFKRQFGGRAVRLAGAHDYFFLDRLADMVIRVVHETKEQL